MLEISNKIKEKAVLVGVGKKYGLNSKSFELDSFDSFEELRCLADTAGAKVVGTMAQLRSEIAPTYYIGKGKAFELKDEVEHLGADMVIFDNDLTPAQVSNLVKLLEIKVIDRPGLILDIFSLRAKTHEAKIQVELAQLKYILPRLTRQWTHLSRQQGGIGTRGPGETQIEVDRRSIRKRITYLTNALKKIDRRRATSRKKRKGYFKAALVGYTNAGKSTLINALSGAGVPVEDKLFKTIDSVTRLVRYGFASDILISDTVGFIRNLPHDLIASFKSTLDEVREADALLHVIDITNPEWEEQVEVVNNVLIDLGSSETKTIMVFNKIDILENTAELSVLGKRYPDAVFLSAKYDTGIEELKTSLINAAMRDRLKLTMEFGPKDGLKMRDIYRYGTVLETRSNGDSVELTFTIPISQAEKLNLLKH
ncbi:GTPase HflX [Candidatus Latescibacterota bacterium]